MISPTSPRLTCKPYPCIYADHTANCIDTGNEYMPNCHNGEKYTYSCKCSYYDHVTTCITKSSNIHPQPPAATTMSSGDPIVLRFSTLCITNMTASGRTIGPEPECDISTLSKMTLLLYVDPACTYATMSPGLCIVHFFLYQSSAEGFSPRHLQPFHLILITCAFPTW